jgi:hypothetical protein
MHKKTRTPRYWRRSSSSPELRCSQIKPTAKMREVIGKLGDLPKEAEQEAADIASLQRKVQSLEADARLHKCSGDDRASEAKLRSLESGHKIHIKLWRLFYMIEKLNNGGSSNR